MEAQLQLACLFGLSLVPFLSVLAGSLRVLLLSESKHCLDFYKCYIRFKCAPQSFPRAKLVKKKKKKKPLLLSAMKTFLL